MSVIIDNSVALAWVLPDEKSDSAEAVLEWVIEAGAYVPFIFPAEFSNGLTMAVRKQRINKAERSIAFDRITNVLHIIADAEGPSRMNVVIELADAHELTVYDALYLELAQRLRLPLATFDKQLVRAARQTDVSLALPEA